MISEHFLRINRDKSVKEPRLRVSTPSARLGLVGVDVFIGSEKGKLPKSAESRYFK